MQSHFTFVICDLFVGEFQCPVLNKVFTEFTHIVAVKTTGNVFCYEVGCHKLSQGGSLMLYFILS